MCLRTHARVPKIMKDKFSALKLGFGMNHTMSGSRSKPSFFNYINPYMIPFQTIKKILRENLKFTRNSESKREFFIKLPQVNFILIGTFSSLDPRILKFTNHFCSVMNRFNREERSKSSQRAFCCEVYVLTSFPSFMPF